MNILNDARGSLWRKWDMHVHTPASFFHGYGGDGEDVWERFIEDLAGLPPEIEVLGINDYLTVDGYDRLRSEKATGRLPNIKLMLPVIELRLNSFGGTNSALRKVNFHVIFSDELTPEQIREQFLSQLLHKIDLGEGRVWQAAPSPASIRDLGQMVIDSVPEEKRKDFNSAIEEGFANLTYPLTTVQKALENFYLRGKYFTAVGKTEWWSIKWNEQSIADKRNIIEAADFVFIAAADPEHCTRAKDALTTSGVNNRLLDCSDAHYFSNSSQKDRIGNTSAWLKADPTFEGLRQVRHAPAERIFHGHVPPKVQLVLEKPTKFVHGLSIRRKADATLSEIWFDNQLELNPDLVAIIGNKGMGKSALTDIIALVANADAPSDAYAFLHDRRFRERPDIKARHFVAELTWASGDSQSRGLEEGVLAGTVPQVRYIPQNYFESLCNETRDAGKLQRELRKVIFSNLSDIQRGKFAGLDELISDRTSEIEHRIDELRAEVRGLNRAILEVERELSRSRLAELADLLSQKEAALAAHDRNLPTPVLKPTDGQDSTAIDSAREQLAAIEGLIAREREKMQETLEGRAAVSRILTRLQAVQDAVDRAREALAVDLERVGLSFDDVFRGGPEPEAVTVVDRALADTLRVMGTTLDGAGGLVEQASNVRRRINELQQELDAPTLAYQQYLDVQRRWEEQRGIISGSVDVPDTIENLRARLSAGKAQQEALLGDLLDQRLNLVRAIHSQQLTITTFLKTLYAGVETRLAEYPAILEQLKVNFDATLTDVGFASQFMTAISRNRVGAFSEETSVRDLLLGYDFTVTAEVVRFVEDIWRMLHLSAKGEPGDIDEVLRQLRGQWQTKPEDLYNLVSDLSFLTPRYALRVAEREVHQLTPGERGSLLLVFYLIIDRDDRPLLIDQPEENLDNQSVFELLVPCIKDAKSRRQIIMVTHNPNLAVVCNAEQVVWCRIDKDNDHRVTYESGGLEHPQIKKHVVDVLEGTWPAFADRRDKYRSRYEAN